MVEEALYKLVRSSSEPVQVEPPVSLRLISYTRQGPLLVAAAARITVSKKPLQRAMEMSEDEVEKWIRELFSRGHGSPLEHSSYSFEASCSRVCSHQLVRHRHASYTQHSMRWSEGFLRAAVAEACRLLGEKCPRKPRSSQDYAVYASILEKAVSVLEDAQLVWVASKGYVLPPPYARDRLKILASISRSLLLSTSEYYRLLSNGLRSEDARLVVPQAVRTRIVFTMNARELAEVFLPLRMCTRAQWEIRLLAWKAWKLLVKIHPQIFKWTGPRCVLLENRARRNPCSLWEYLDGGCGFTVEKCPEKTPRDGIPACLHYAASTESRIIRG